MAESDHAAARALAAIIHTARDDVAWSGIVDLPLIEAALEHDVGPLVYHSLRQRPEWERQAEPVRDALAQIASEAAVLDRLRVDTDRSVVATLSAAGLAPLIFKGAALAHRLYPASWLRPRVDTDLLIRGREQADAAAVLDRMGLTRVPRPTGDYVTHQFTYVGTVHGIRAEYDVHWKIADPQVFADVLSYDELAGEAVPVPELGPAARTIGDVYALIVACTHRIAHHYDSHSLLFLYDIDLLGRRLDDEAWDRLVALASDKRIRGVCERGLALASELFATPVPPRVMRALAVIDDDEPSAAHLRHRLRRVDVLRSDLHALGDWRARARLLREHLLPPPAYILASYGQTRAALLPVLYVHRIVRGALKWFRPLRSR